ncbi:unnamed protein product [Clonostachys rhizophaga]|uniref:Uncharacterized protein n=1 Tax=Clonostachys rhizophaga TaxID=160324 RepID=A0A9N9V6Q2_9HYPO|nr:unnamed protein product [Clonostachys rhizophaga]
MLLERDSNDGSEEGLEDGGQATDEASVGEQTVVDIYEAAVGLCDGPADSLSQFELNPVLLVIAKVLVKGTAELVIERSANGLEHTVKLRLDKQSLPTVENRAVVSKGEFGLVHLRHRVGDVEATCRLHQHPSDHAGRQQNLLAKTHARDNDWLPMFEILDFRLASLGESAKVRWAPMGWRKCELLWSLAVCVVSPSRAQTESPCARGLADQRDVIGIGDADDEALDDIDDSAEGDATGDQRV